ncbi:MAG: hypothetical protein V3R30_14400 [Kiloniellales bacterium]
MSETSYHVYPPLPIGMAFWAAGDLARAGTGEDLLVAEIDPSAIGRARAGYDYLADCRAGLDVNEGRRETA